MTSLNEDQNVLQLDERGRVRLSKERWEGLLEEFARLAGIKYPTFMYWLKQRRESGGGEFTARG